VDVRKQALLDGALFLFALEVSNSMMTPLLMYIFSCACLDRSYNFLVFFVHAVGVEWVCSQS
jgi:hypothetical protein